MHEIQNYNKLYLRSFPLFLAFKNEKNSTCQLLLPCIKYN